MPKLNDSKPYYENRTRREIVKGLTGYTWDSWRKKCERAGKDPYETATLHAHILLNGVKK